MRYFRLTDDIAIPGRWHLGGVRIIDVKKTSQADAFQEKQ
jgi:hypothetical protein